MSGKQIPIETQTIKLDSFLKWAGIVSTGGQAKWLLKDGNVEINGEAEFQRGRKLRDGDEVTVKGVGTFQLTVEGESEMEN